MQICLLTKRKIGNWHIYGQAYHFMLWPAMTNCTHLWKGLAAGCHSKKSNWDNKMSDLIKPNSLLSDFKISKNFMNEAKHIPSVQLFLITYFVRKRVRAPKAKCRKYNYDSAKIFSLRAENQSAKKMKAPKRFTQLFWFYSPKKIILVLLPKLPFIS